MTFRRGLQIALTAVLMALILPGCKRNQTPDIPAAPDGPGQGFINTVYGFSAIGQDPDGDSVALQFDWGDGNQTAWSGFVPNGSAVTSSKAYSTYHTYQVKARAKDQHEAVSDWSAAHQIAIGNSPPLTPKIIAGPDTVWFTNSAAFLATGTDPDRDPLRFQFAWGDGDTSDWLQPTGGETACSASHSWQAPGLFRLKARTKDTSGAVSPWSQAFGLTVLGLAQPVAYQYRKQLY